MKLKRPILFVFIAIFAAAGVYALLQTGAAPKRQTPAVTLALAPASERVSVGQSLTFGVRLNTNGQAVNAVQANLLYPVGTFEFVRVDSAGSAFEVEAEATHNNGEIKIARGSVSSVTSSDALVATVELRALTPARRAKVTFANTSAVLSSSSSTNILERLTGGSYNVQ